MPFLLLWQGWGVAAPQADDVNLIGTLAVLHYPRASAGDRSPISVIVLDGGVPIALLPVRSYPLANASVRVYPKATIVRTEPTTTLPGAMAVQAYPMAAIGVSPAVPTATIGLKEHV